MNEFLKYLKMIPVIIYPYIYVLILAVFFLFVGVLPEDTTDISLLVLLIIAVIYNLYSFVIVIVNAVQTAKGKLTAGQAARMNLIIKGIQIPAYIMHFILGFIGLAMSVWGIGFLLWAVLIDLLTILLTGISSIGCSIRMRKERLVSLPGAIFMGIGCFIYCADVVIAIDALAARSTARLNRTIQITDTGISPGSGVGNHREGLNEENLSVRVIGIGVPTVVDAATIVHDSMAHLLEALEEAEQKEFLEEMISPHLHTMFVTPKDVDETVKYLSFTISEGLNMAFEEIGG